MPSPSKNYSNVKAGWSQQDQRGERTFYDQHKSAKFPQGRPWWAWCERPAEGAAMPMPVGELMPKGWDAPWLPDQKYIVESIGKATPGTTAEDFRFRIAYASIIQDRQRAMKDYYDRAVLEAIGQGWQAPNYGDPITYRLRAIVGPPPLSPKIPEAAMAEDPWILGFSQSENETLARLLELGSGTEDILTAAQSEGKMDKVAELEQKMAAQSDLIQKLLDRDRAQDAVKIDGRSKAARAARKPQTASAE